MKHIEEYILEAKSSKNSYTEEKLREIQKTYKGKDNYLMGGIEDEDYHLYVKPNNFKGKFFNKVEDSRGIFLEQFIEDINKAASELFVFLKTWDKIDTQSRINNMNKTNYCLLLPETGMLFNSLKEAKSWIKEHQHCKYVDNAKRIKCNPMKLSEANEKLQELFKNYKYTIGHGVYMHD